MTTRFTPSLHRAYKIRSTKTWDYGRNCQPIPVRRSYLMPLQALDICRETPPIIPQLQSPMARIQFLWWEQIPSPIFPWNLIDSKAAVQAIGFEILGFTSDDVGTHSNRAGGAMMMYLSTPKISIYTIIMIGRWSSIAFLRYIEKQVKHESRIMHSIKSRHNPGLKLAPKLRMLIPAFQLASSSK